MYTDDPIADFNQRDQEEANWLRKRPVCSCCEEHIQDEKMYYIHGENWCEACMKEQFEVNTEDYCFD